MIHYFVGTDKRDALVATKLKTLFHQLCFLISSASMEANKDTEAKVDYSDRKSYNFVGKRSCSRRTKIVIISILLVVLLLGAVIAVSVYFAMRKTTPTHLVEVKLEEGETLEYQVEQEIEIQGNDVQKGEFECFCFNSLFIALTLNRCIAASIIPLFNVNDIDNIP